MLQDFTQTMVSYSAIVTSDSQWLPTGVLTNPTYATVYPSPLECRVGMVDGKLYCGPLNASTFGIDYATLSHPLQPRTPHLIIDIFGGYIPPIGGGGGGGRDNNANVT
jgi:hypothetical protein